LEKTAIVFALALANELKSSDVRNQGIGAE
jgi:hypothetical protein